MFPSHRRENYLQQNLATRFGSIAADLARIQSFAELAIADAIPGLLNESRAFIEWAAPDLLPERVDDAAYLVEVQRGLTQWYWIWNEAQNDPAQRAKLAEQAQEWSIEILYMSGLVDE